MGIVKTLADDILEIMCPEFNAEKMGIVKTNNTPDTR